MKESSAMKSIVFLFFGLLLSTLASAQVFKCKNADGKISFSDTPCTTGSAGGRISVQSNTLDASGEREQAMRNQPKAQNEQVKQLDRKKSDQIGSQSQSEECKQALEEFNYSMQPGAQGVNRTAAKMKVRVMCGLAEPAIVNNVTPNQRLNCTPNGYGMTCR